MRSAKRFGISLRVFLMLTFLSACAGERLSGSPLEQSLLSSGGVQERFRAIRTASREPDAATQQKLQAAFHQLPLSFISNRGQVDERVKFYGRSGSAGFFFARDEVVYSFVRREEAAAPRKVSRSAMERTDGADRRVGCAYRSGCKEKEKEKEEGLDQGHALTENRASGHVIRLRFVGANPDPAIEGGEELPGKVNYFIGNDPARWKSHLSTYSQIRYRELWPGIDLVYRGQGGRLKYEFIVKPGADPGQVRVAYRGIEGMSVSDAGDLILQTASGDLRDRRPVAWQEIGGRRVEVEAGFRVRGTGAPTEASPAAAAAQRSSVVGTVSPTSVEGSHGGSRRGLDYPGGEKLPARVSGSEKRKAGRQPTRPPSMDSMAAQGVASTCPRGRKRVPRGTPRSSTASR